MSDKVNKNDYKASILPTMITLFFYWGALFAYSVYSYVTTGTLGIPFIILNIGLMIYWISMLIYRKKYRGRRS